jgi:hypothetical protein
VGATVRFRDRPPPEWEPPRLPISDLSRFSGGERAAWQAESDYLNAAGVTGSQAAIQRRFPKTNAGYLTDQVLGFATYGVADPAIRP